MRLRYLLDTNVLAEPMRPTPNPGVISRLLELGARAATAAPVWHEIEFGRERIPAGRRRRAIDGLVDQLGDVLIILPYDAAAASWHGCERARLASAGKTPPFVDGQIAVIAALHGLVLVTRNVRDFSRFSGIQVESWFEDGRAP